MAVHSDPAYFFDSGIQFYCRQCGRCCTGAPGLIRVSGAEVAAIATAVGMAPEPFARACLIAVEGGLSIRERADGRCLFFDDGCRIYPHRPYQCRTYPFWLRNLRSEDRWREAKRECPGIGSGPVFSRDAILEGLREQMRFLPDAPYFEEEGASSGTSATRVDPQLPADDGAG